MTWLLLLLQSAAGPSTDTTVVLLSGTAFAVILNAAVTFGIVKGKTDGMEIFKSEVRNALARINDELAEIQRSLGRLEGPHRPNKRTAGRDDE